MVQKAHPLTFSNFFSNHIINPCDKSLSSHDRKVALAASVIFGFFTLGLVHGIVFIARLSLCGRVKKIENPKPHNNGNDTKKTNSSLVIPTVRIKRNSARVLSTELTQQTLLRKIVNHEETTSPFEIQVADLTKEAFEALKEAKHITSIKLCFAEKELSLPQDVKLSELDHIEALEIHVDSLEPQLAKQIASMDNLKHLYLDLYAQGKNSSLSFRTLKGLKNLESLHFGILQHFWGSDEDGNEIHINPLIFTNVFSIKGLKKLSIGRINYLSDMFLRSISSAKNLEELHMPSCIDADADAIVKLGLAAHNKLHCVHLGLKQVDQKVYDAIIDLKKRPIDRDRLVIKTSPLFCPRVKKGRARSLSE